MGCGLRAAGRSPRAAFDRHYRNRRFSGAGLAPFQQRIRAGDGEACSPRATHPFALRKAIVRRAHRWFGHDQRYPARYEPGGDEFLVRWTDRGGA